MLFAAAIVLVLGSMVARALFRQQDTHHQYEEIVQEYTSDFGHLVATLKTPLPVTSPSVVPPSASDTGGPKDGPNPSSSPVPSASVSLPTGTALTPAPLRQGLGTLTVNNGHAVDAVVILVEEMAPRVISQGVYIRAHETATIKDIASGRYRLQFDLGEGWGRSTWQFSREHARLEFLDPFDFQEHQEADGIHYRTFQVTLHPVLFGNARTRPRSRTEWQSGQEGTGWPATVNPEQTRRY